MKVFLSWSGERSKKVAETLRDWLPSVIQSIEPWLSVDIEKGSRWGVDLSTQLKQSKVGIICLTPENLTSSWILFEAGAISTTLEQTYVCPFLLDLHPTDITGPLAQFQTTTPQKDDTHQLLKTINHALGDTSLPEGKLRTAFEKWWPDLEQSILNIPQPGNPILTERRSDRELLEEVLLLNRKNELLHQGTLTGFQYLFDILKKAIVIEDPETGITRTVDSEFNELTAPYVKQANEIEVGHFAKTEPPSNKKRQTHRANKNPKTE